MQNQSADSGQDESTDAHGREPSGSEQWTGAYNLFDVKAGVEDEDTKGAVLEE